MGYAEVIEEKVRAFIEEHRMISPGDKVVAGVSGGADSVCLLFVLLKLSREFPFGLHVVHVNHGIREEAGEDAEYVRSLCLRCGVGFTLVEERVRERAEAEKLSEEEAGRMARYEAFEDALAETGADRIAVAHNSNDQAETMLFHLFRGSGMAGLCGIRPVRGRIIRPLLCLERGEIERYLEEKKIPYCRDVTNDGDGYTRNRIRHHILSYAQSEVAKGCVEHMARTAAMLQETEDFLEKMTRRAFSETVRETLGEDRCSAGEHAGAGASGGAFEICCDDYKRLEPVIAGRLIRQILERLSPGGRDISYGHVRGIEELFLREGNRTLCLPYGIRALRQYGRVWIGRAAEDGSQAAVESSPREGKPAENFAVDLKKLTEGEVLVPAGRGRVLCFGVLSGKKYEELPENGCTKWFDYDKIKGLLHVRPRETGDYLSIRGAQGQVIRKTVKDYMITEKIPRQERDRIPLVACGSHVLWLVGYRISEFYKISANTERILQVQLREGCVGGDTEEDDGGAC